MRARPALYLLLFVNACAFAQTDFRHDLKFNALPTRWDEALPLGNGIAGVLVWQKEGKLRLSIDRADLWDLRPTADLDQLTFAKVAGHVKAGTYAEVQRLGDLPYERDPAPTKIPGAAIEFDVRSLGEVSSSRLHIREGVAEARWKSGIAFTTFVHPTLPVGWFRMTRNSAAPMLQPPRYADAENKGDGNSVEGQGLARLGYPQGTVTSAPNQIQYVQPGWNGFEYQVTVKWQLADGHLEGVWAITSNYATTNTQTSSALAADALSRGFMADLNLSKSWWANFWSKSSLTLPDSLLERQWYLEQYKFGCVARPDGPPITLQAIWTADNGNLPPWKGDIHNDLNLQLSYWPSYSGNHLSEAAGMVNWLHRSRPEFERWTKNYFGADGLNAPGVCTLDGKAMGGWIQYSLSPTTAGWLGQHFYLHWRYSMDRRFLEEKAYPWVRDFARFIQRIAVTEGNGLRKLPLSSSPEFHDNSVNAWFGQTTNYDLAIIRWTFEKAEEMASHLRLTDEAAQWHRELALWPPLAQGEDGALLLAPGQPYPESHRHFSHLLGIHPLGLFDYDAPSGKQVMDASINSLLEKGTKAWVGYSFAWLGNIYARMKKGDEAVQALRTFASCFCLSNSFHANGDQCGGKNSSYTYRPFTLEGNFAFAAGVQELLLQSQGGVIRLFPAVPASWKEVRFEGLRAEGAFVISAKREAGQLTEVAIRSEKGGELVIENIPTEWLRGVHAYSKKDNRIILNTRPGQEIRLSASK
jgi:alpha-L-fucosidase 2